MLKPAPTRLRLVLWSLFAGLDTFPESPPPGLVTIPNIAEVPKQHYTLSGYHPSGTRAIRIDMLERLADILRQKDSKAGFEATPDMLSITGMTLDQFADLMAGLGYKSEKGERAKVKAPVTASEPAISEEAAAAIAAGLPIPEEVSVAAPPPEPEAEPEVPEMETFLTFTWAPKPRFQRPERKPEGERAPRPAGERRERPKADRPAGDKPQGDRPPREPRADRPQGDRPQGDRPKFDKPRGDRPQGDRPQGDRFKGKDDRKGGKPPQGERKYEARPPRVEKPIDPDNPFAALLALKGKV